MFKKGTIIFFLIVLLLISFYRISNVYAAQTTTTIVIEASGDDGYIYGYHSVYLTARTDAATKVSSDVAADLAIGQLLYSGIYYVYRSFLKFNTTSIPAGAIISSARFCISGYSDTSITDFVIALQKWTGDVPITTADYCQYDNVNYDDGGFNTASWVLESYNNITISNFDLITKEGWTYICVRSDKEVDADPPIGSNYERVNGYSFEGGAGRRPLLVITWALVDWYNVENWFITLQVRGWYDIENWFVTFLTKFWYPVEYWGLIEFYSIGVVSFFKWLGVGLVLGIVLLLAFIEERKSK